MNGIARETLALRRGGFSPPFLAPLLVTYAYICFSRRSSAGRPAHSTHRECSPTDTFYNAIPRLRHLPYTRLLSTRTPSTSELLRTL